METPSSPPDAVTSALTLRFHPVAEYFRLQFARALRWGLTPSDARITCIEGHACTNFLRLEVAMTALRPLTIGEILTVDGEMNAPGVTQRVLLEIVQTIPLLPAEVSWVAMAWDHLRQARNGKGRDLVVHGLSEAFVQLLDQQRLSGGCALVLSRFVPTTYQTELTALMGGVAAAPPAEAPPTPGRAEWRPVWQAVAAGNRAEVTRLTEQRGWSDRHLYRVRRAVARLGALIDLPLAQRQLLALSTWPTPLLDALRTAGQLTCDGERITTTQLPTWSVAALTQFPARWQRTAADTAEKGHD
jgi:hypothetical protein